MKKIFFISFLLCVILLTSSTGSFAQDKIILRAAGGGLQGQWFATTAAFAAIVAEEDPSIQIDVVPGAGMANPARLGEGEIEMSLSFPPFTNAAFNGRLPYEKAYSDIRDGIKGFGPSFLQFIVTADIKYDTVEDLIKNKYPINLAVERQGTTDRYGCEQILAYYGIDYATIESWGGSVKFMGYGDQVTMVKDGHANAVFVNIAVPAPSIVEMGVSKKIKVLKYSDELLDFLNKNYSFSIGTIPAGTYGVVEEDMRAPGMDTSMLFHKDIPEDVVYRITKIICENADDVRQIHSSTAEFDSAKAAQDLGAPLHPGAERYYREAGYLK